MGSTLLFSAVETIFLILQTASAERSAPRKSFYITPLMGFNLGLPECLGRNPER